jgi:hypothetical protein
MVTLLLKDLPLKQAVQLTVQMIGMGRNELYPRTANQRAGISIRSCGFICLPQNLFRAELGFHHNPDILEERGGQYPAGADNDRIVVQFDGLSIVLQEHFVVRDKFHV